MAKSILIIGMSRFGRHLAKRLTELGNDVMVVDKNEEIINKYGSTFTDALCGDCTNEDVIKALGVNSFDICFVAIGDDFQSSLVITALLKENKAKFVVTKAKQDIQEDLLKRIGADEIVYPDKEMAEKAARKYNAKNVFDYIELSEEYSVYETALPAEWEGKSINELNIRQKYKLNIIAIKAGTYLNPIPSADYIFRKDDHIVVIGKNTDVSKLTKRT
jgi:trk system potassium uptake protein TrkA